MDNKTRKSLKKSKIVAQLPNLKESTIQTSNLGLQPSRQIEPIVIPNAIPTQNNSSNLVNSPLPGNIIPSNSGLQGAPVVGENPNIRENIPAQKPIKLGTNLGVFAYYSTEMPLKNGFKSSEKWFTQVIDAQGKLKVWNTKEQNNLNLDANGWAKSFNSTTGTQQYTSITTQLYTGLNGNYKGGKYVVLYDGEGQLQYRYDGQKDVALSRPNRDVINVTPTNNGILLNIVGINQNNYLRNIRVVPIEYENNYQTEIFNPKFIEKIDPFGTLRFMDWMRTNNSSQKDWINRPTLNTSTWLGSGVPVEAMVTLANQTNSNPWVTIPHQATDDYVRQFAQYVKNNLNPGLKVYVEYSNEVWNNSFGQSTWVEQQGKNAWPTSTDSNNTKKINWYSKRTTEVVGIWNQVFNTQTDSVIGVMSAQSANVWTGQQALNYAWSNSTKTSGDYGIKAIATAPYFGYYLGDPKNQAQVQAWTADADGGLNKLFTEITKGGVLVGGPAGGALQESYNQISAYATLAKQKNLELVAYEGGQHLAGFSGVQNNQAINNLFHQANRDPRMGQIYTEYLTKWNQLGGGLFVNYSSIGAATQNGSWGLLEHVNQSGSPKYNALLGLLIQ